MSDDKVMSVGSWMQPPMKLPPLPPWVDKLIMQPQRAGKVAAMEALVARLRAEGYTVEVWDPKGGVER